MYAIENALGRFEGETEKEAKKLLRAKQREVIKKEKQAEIDLAIAKERAQSVAYDFLCRLVRQEGCPSGWRFYHCGSNYCAPATIDEPMLSFGYYFSTVTARTKWGTIVVKEISSKFIGSVRNGNGHDCILVFEEKNGTLLWYAVGTSGDKWSLIDVPGLSIEWFTRSRA